MNKCDIDPDRALRTSVRCSPTVWASWVDHGRHDAGLFVDEHFGDRMCTNFGSNSLCELKNTRVVQNQIT